MPEFERLALLAAQRTAGTVTIRWADRPPQPAEPADAADAFVAREGFRPIGARWFPLAPLDAVHALAAQLHRSLAYGVEAMPQAEANALASAFFDCVGQAQRVCLTNLANESWDPVAGSTFEAAFIALDDRRIGLLLIEEED